MSNVYTELRSDLWKLLEYENQNLSWDTLEPFTAALRYVAQDGFKLYRYSPADYFNIRNFEKGKLYLSCNGGLNDIYEGLPVFDIDDTERERLHILKDCAYIKCFSENYDSNVMWAHYADNHKGICVEYDLSLIDYENDLYYHIFPVLYSDVRPFSGAAVLEVCDNQKWLNEDIFHNAYPNDSSILNDALILFLFKGEEWDYEEEWRIVYSKYQLYCKSDQVEIDNTIAFDYATAIHFGHRVNPEIRRNLMEIIERINISRGNTGKPAIRVYDMMPDDKTYLLKRNEYRKNKEE